ncbi:hypothetical protein PUN28_002827 [Cardiocondyla obscurior]|uniref:Uncharacterized protein n=1 Tax=Cardiocondyla obscurior TaxID=286306 RepID=A0AAW2GW76_9HYME
MLAYIRIVIRIIAMEMRNVVEVARKWCQEEAWYMRKGLQKITVTNTTELQPVLLPARPKCNFNISNQYLLRD